MGRLAIRGELDLAPAFLWLSPIAFWAKNEACLAPLEEESEPWPGLCTEVLPRRGGRAPRAFREGSALARLGVWAAHRFLTLCNILALSLRRSVSKPLAVPAVGHL